MSNVSGASSGQYISNADILGWMQLQTDRLYQKMGDAMDLSNDRSDAEDAMNAIKNKIADVSAGKADANELYGKLHDAIQKYGDEFPDLKTALGSISQELKADGAQLPDPGTQPPPVQDIPAPPQEFESLYMGGQKTTQAYEIWNIKYGAEAKADPRRVIGWTQSPPIKIDDATSQRWQSEVKDQVDAFSKQDQLSLVNIQQYDAQLNQAKQTASALMDASDKTASSIINHID